MKKKNPLISICIPCMNRTYDLKKVMSSIIKSANASPPVEILILNYNSRDELDDYIERIKKRKLAKENILSYVKYNKGEYYQVAHARNLSILSSKGQYFFSSCADIILSIDFFKAIRNYLRKYDVDWMSCRRFIELVVCKRKEFIVCGGYDERFRFYGPAGKDLVKRLERRDLKHKRFSSKLLDVIHTQGSRKFVNFELGKKKRIIKRQIKAMAKIYLDNINNKILVANKGKKWGMM